MVVHGWSSAGSYLADPTSPIPSHCAVITRFKSVAVNQLSWLALKELNQMFLMYVPASCGNCLVWTFDTVAAISKWNSRHCTSGYAQYHGTTDLGCERKQHVEHFVSYAYSMSTTLTGECLLCALLIWFWTTIQIAIDDTDLFYTEKSHVLK